MICLVAGAAEESWAAGTVGAAAGGAGSAPNTPDETPKDNEADRRMSCARMMTLPS